MTAYCVGITQTTVYKLKSVSLPTLLPPVIPFSPLAYVGLTCAWPLVGTFAKVTSSDEAPAAFTNIQSE